MKRVTMLVLIILTIFSLSLAACGKDNSVEVEGLTDAQVEWAKAAEMGPYAPETQDWVAIEAAAKQEGKVVIYSNSSRWETIKESFEAQYPGIIVEGYDISTVDLITKFQTEQKSNIYTADVILSGDYATLVNEMLDPPNKMLWNFVPDELRSVSDPATLEPLLLHRYSIVAFGYNTEVNAEPPVKSIWDLTKPEWKGRIVYPDPQKVYMGLNSLVVITMNGDKMAEEYKKVFGQDIVLDEGVPNAGYQWIKDLLENDPVLTSSSGDAATAIGALGQTNPPVGFTTYSKIRNSLKGEIAFDVMWGMTPILGFTEETGLAIANQAPHPNAAKLLVKWMKGDATGGQGFTPFFVPGDYSTRTDAPAPEGAKPLNEILGQVWSGADDIKYIYQNAIPVRDFWIANLNQ